MTKATYKKSGVDIDAANSFIDAIKPSIKTTMRSEVLGGVGGFGSLFKLQTRKYKNPILVSSTDGVGTKLKLAREFDRYAMLGIDLVAMNVNDIVTCGAEPLFFLDYFAVGKIKIPFMKDVVQGITEGCRQAGCALVGGETAEMPGLYKGGDFDLAGFAVGVVDEHKRVDGRDVKAGDVVIGLASSGFHANGFSMVRKVLGRAFIKKHADEILKPTKIYVKPVFEVMKKIQVKAMAHITGGGFYDNIPRVLPKGFGIQINDGSWKIPSVFKWIREKGNVTYREMHRTFNMGIGFVMIVPKADALKTINILAKDKVHAWPIGAVTRREGVVFQ